MDFSQSVVRGDIYIVSIWWKETSTVQLQRGSPQEHSGQTDNDKEATKIDTTGSFTKTQISTRKVHNRFRADRNRVAETNMIHPLTMFNNDSGSIPSSKEGKE